MKFCSLSKIFIDYLNTPQRTLPDQTKKSTPSAHGQVSKTGPEGVELHPVQGTEPYTNSPSEAPPR